MSDDPSPGEIIAASNRAAGPDEGGLIQVMVDEVLAVLKDRLPGEVHIAAFPDRPQEFDLGTHSAVVLVHYRGSKYGPAAGNGSASQERRAALDIHVLSRGLPEASGAYALVEVVRLALQGHRLPVLGLVEIGDDGLIGETAGVWHYVVQLRGRTLAAAQRQAAFSPLRVNFPQRP